MDRRTYNLAIVSFIGQSESSLYWVRLFLVSSKVTPDCTLYFVKLSLWNAGYGAGKRRPVEYFYIVLYLFICLCVCVYVCGGGTCVSVLPRFACL